MPGERAFLAGSILALCLALPGTASAQGAQQKHCRLIRVASLDITIEPDGVATVPVRISGKTYPFAIGLSDPLTEVSWHLSHELHLHRALPIPGIKIQVSQSGENLGRVLLPNVQIGVVSAKQIAVFESLKDTDEDGDVDGIVGGDILANYDDEFDLTAGKLNLYSQHHCPGEVVYWAPTYAVVPFKLNSAGTPYFTTQLDGKAVIATFSTSDFFASMSMLDAEELLGSAFDKTKLVAMAKPPPHVKKAFRYPFKTLAIGGITIKNPDIVIIHSQTEQEAREECRVKLEALRHVHMCLGPARFTLGRSEMRKLHLYFAFKEKKLYVTAANAGKSGGNQ